MLDVLVGSKNVERILLFLFVNGKCYGTKLQKQLNVPLTPIQKGLERLEKAGIIQSSFEGKTKLYRFNASYPLHEELEAVLQKAYALLSTQEKKLYCCFSPDEKLSYGESEAEKREHMAQLAFFWQRLGTTKELTIETGALEKRSHGVLRSGKGQVVVQKDGDATLIFHETGLWQGEDGHEVHFKNSYRWSLDLERRLISLEHLRYGLKNPVFLFHLVPSGKNSLASLDSHLCANDMYLGSVVYNHHCIQLEWRVIGPKKNETMSYFYR